MWGKRCAETFLPSLTAENTACLLRVCLCLSFGALFAETIFTEFLSDSCHEYAKTKIRSIPRLCSILISAPHYTFVCTWLVAFKTRRTLLLVSLRPRTGQRAVLILSLSSLLQFSTPLVQNSSVGGGESDRTVLSVASRFSSVGSRDWLDAQSRVRGCNADDGSALPAPLLRQVGQALLMRPGVPDWLPGVRSGRGSLSVIARQCGGVVLRVFKCHLRLYFSCFALLLGDASSSGFASLSLASVAVPCCAIHGLAEHWERHVALCSCLRQRACLGFVHLHTSKP